MTPLSVAELTKSCRSAPAVGLALLQVALARRKKKRRYPHMFFITVERLSTLSGIADRFTIRTALDALEAAGCVRRTLEMRRGRDGAPIRKPGGVVLKFTRVRLLQKLRDFIAPAPVVGNVDAEGTNPPVLTKVRGDDTAARSLCSAPLDGGMSSRLIELVKLMYRQHDADYFHERDAKDKLFARNSAAVRDFVQQWWQSAADSLTEKLGSEADAWWQTAPEADAFDKGPSHVFECLLHVENKLYELQKGTPNAGTQAESDPEGKKAAGTASGTTPQPGA